jgi:signal peptidase I
MDGVAASPSPLWMKVVFGRNPKRTLVRLLCLVTISLVLFRFILIPIRVSGFSMMPTYSDGKINVINHLAYRFTKPKRGDVIAFRAFPENVVLLKRIVGLPGERVRVERGRVFINGRKLDEPYPLKTKSDHLPTQPEIKLDQGQYFVMGDNRDITVYGPVLERMILGKVLF